MQDVSAIERQHGEQIEAVDDQEEDGRVVQPFAMRDQTHQGQRHAQQDARHRTRERDDGLLPAGHVPVLPRDGRTEERDEKHAEIAVAEDLHGQPVTAFVEEQERDEPEIKFPITLRAAGGDEGEDRDHEDDEGVFPTGPLRLDALDLGQNLGMAQSADGGFLQTRRHGRGAGLLGLGADAEHAPRQIEVAQQNVMALRGAEQFLARVDGPDGGRVFRGDGFKVRLPEHGRRGAMEPHHRHDIGRGEVWFARG